MANKDNRDLAGPNNTEGISRRPRDSRFYSSGDMGPDDYAFDDEDQVYDGRQAYYRSRPPAMQQSMQQHDREADPRRETRRPGGQSNRPGRSRHEYGREDVNMADRNDEGNWTRQVRENWQKGPYRDYGWESGESVLPEFRDPSVHRNREEEAEDRDWRREQGSRPRSRGGEFSYDYDARRAGNMPTGQRELRSGGGPGYDREAVRRQGPYTGKGPKNYQRSNERIMEDINERLTRHGDIDASDIEVRVENGEAWLTGTVENRQQKRLAEDVADSVTGVKDIHNELRIQHKE